MDTICTVENNSLYLASFSVYSWKIVYVDVRWLRMDEETRIKYVQEEAVLNLKDDVALLQHLHPEV